MDKLIKIALETRKKAYAPYSKFKVGAALETKDGKVYTGCNVENASYGLTACAEQTAILKAVSDGQRKFKRMAIVTGSKTLTPPCGMCRQFLSEFGENIEIILANIHGAKKKTTLTKLFPEPFKFLLE